MLSPSLFVFNEVLTNSLSSALESLLGRGVRDIVYYILESKGIRRDDIPSRFDKVMEVLLQVFGEGSRVVIHRVLRVLYEKYSLPVNFSYQEILSERLTVLRDKIIVDNLRPRGDEYFGLPDRPAEPRNHYSSIDNQKSGKSSFDSLNKGSGSNRD